MKLLANDLNLEITGSADKAINALDRLINKLAEYQGRLISTIPKMNQFNNALRDLPSNAGNKYKDLASGINAVATALKKFDNKTGLSSLKNELEMIKQSSSGLDVTADKLTNVSNAMMNTKGASKLSAELAKYQSQIDIADARTQSALAKAAYDTENYALKTGKLNEQKEKLAETERKLAENTSWSEEAEKSLSEAVNRANLKHNQTFSANDFQTQKISSPMNDIYAGRDIQAEIDALQRTSFPEIDTSQINEAIKETEAYIQSLYPAFENMSTSAQIQFNSVATKLREVNIELEQQKQLYANLTQDYETLSKGFSPEIADMNGFDIKIKASSEKVKELTDKLNELKKALEKLSTPAKQTAKDVEKAGQSSKTASREFSTFDRVIRNLRTYLLVRAINEISQAFSNALTNAMTFTENMNLFNVSIGENVYQAGEFVDKMSAAFGMDPSNLVKTMGTFYQISRSMGMTSQNAYVLSENFTKLANDLSSFYNISVSDATTKLEAGLVGETEPLRRLGIITTENALKQTAMNLGIEKSVRDMSEAEKMHLRYITVLNQTKNLQGDFARTISEPAQLVKILQEQISQLGRALGSVFMPVLGAVLPYIIAFSRALTTLIGSLAALLGYKAPDYKNLSTGFSSAVGESDKLGDSVGKAAAKAKEFKKLVMSFDELHILTNPANTSGGSGSGSGASDFVVPDLTGYDNLMDTVDTKIDEIYQNIMAFFNNIGKVLEPTIQAFSRLGLELDRLNGFAWQGLLDFYNSFLVPVGSWVFGEGLPKFIDALTNGLAQVDYSKINTSLNELWKALTPFSIAIGEGLLWFWENVLVPIGTWTLNNAVPVFLNLISGALTFLTPVIEGFKSAFDWIWNSFLKPIAQWTGGVICSVLSELAKILTNIGNWMSDHQELIDNMAIVVTSFAVAWALVNLAIGIWNVIGAIATIVTTGFGVAVAFLTSPIGLVILAIAAVIAIVVLLIKYWDDIEKAATDCWNWIVDTWSSAWKWFDGNVVTPIKNFFIELWNSVTEKAMNCWNAVVNVWNVVSNWFNQNIIKPIITLFSGLWDGIKNIFGVVSSWFGNVFVQAYNAVTNAFSGVKNFFSGIWDNIKSTFTSIGSTIGNAIGGAFKTVVNSIINFAESTINGFIRAINTAISLINMIPGVKVNKLSELSIPRLSKGALVTDSVIANIGEGKDEEAVIPLNDQVFKKLAEGINKNNADNNSSISEESLYRAFLRALEDAPEKTATFIATLNNKVIAKEVLKEQQNSDRRFNPVRS